MEDNIKGMMDDIQNVVSTHFSDVIKDFEDTIGAINTLPLVITLRKKIRKLENENKQLKMLIKGIGEEKNIELEIVEVQKEDSSLESEQHITNFDAISSDEEISEDELEMVQDNQVNTPEDVIDTKKIIANDLHDI